jgi:hypothetical protein
VNVLDCIYAVEMQKLRISKKYFVSLPLPSEWKEWRQKTYFSEIKNIFQKVIVDLPHLHSFGWRTRGVFEFAVKDTNTTIR